jgi:hypothetical protein
VNLRKIQIPEPNETKVCFILISSNSKLSHEITCIHYEVRGFQGEDTDCDVEDYDVM